MKKVFSSAATVTAAFAAQTQDYGRVSSGNIYFHNNVIYSYGSHFPMCRIIGDTALLTSQGYSSSTGKHISAVHTALRNAGLTIIIVNDVLANTLDDHARNAWYIRNEVKKMRGKAQRARKYTDMWNDQADRREQAGEAYKQWLLDLVSKFDDMVASYDEVKIAA